MILKNLEGSVSSRGGSDLFVFWSHQERRASANTSRHRNQTSHVTGICLLPEHFHLCRRTPEDRLAAGSTACDASHEWLRFVPFHRSNSKLHPTESFSPNKAFVTSSQDHRVSIHSDLIFNENHIHLMEISFRTASVLLTAAGEPEEGSKM